MSKSFEKYQKRRLRASYFSVVLSITLVLMLVGFLGLILLKYNKISAYFKEQVKLTVYVNDNALQEDVKAIAVLLKSKKYTQKIIYKSKYTAAKEFSKEVGEDFVSFLGTNPLKSYYEVTLNADFVDSKQLKQIKKSLEDEVYVDEAAYNDVLVDLLTENIKSIGSWIMIVVGVLTIFAFLLMNSAVRLSIYSNRFIIKTMQMVGATKAFIRKPFIMNSVKLGLVGATIATVVFLLVCARLDTALPALRILSEWSVLFLVVLVIYVSGVLITTVSAFLATQRFLNLKVDDLY